MIPPGKTLVIDGSKYQQRIDIPLLQASSVRGVIWKATMGAGMDSTWERTAAQVAASSLPLMAYHWCDPIYSPETQAQRFLDAVRGKPVKALFVDIEQWWSQWGPWYEALARRLAWSFVLRFRPEQISAHAYRVVAYLRSHSDLPVIVYTSRGFVHSYALPMTQWLPATQLWIANYIQPSARVELSWPEFIANHIPQGRPLLPDGCSMDQVIGWQFTGDRFLLPGVYGDLAGKVRSPLDVSLFDSVWIARLTGALPQPVPEPEPESPTYMTHLPYIVTASELNIRSGPSTSFAIVGQMQAGQRVNITQAAGGDVWGKIDEGRWAAIKIGATTYMKPDDG